MSDIVWEDPPENINSGPRGKFVAFLDELRAHPGKWAVVPSSLCLGKHSARNTAHNIKRGVIKGATAGEFDATSRTLEDGSIVAYVRFVGGDS